MGSESILEALSLFENNKVHFINQQEQMITYAKKINKKESEIDWNDSAKKIVAKINGLNPYPGVWFEHKGTRIKIIKAETSDYKGKIGEVLTNNLDIGCQDKSIRINLLQKAGKKVITTKSFLKGYKIIKGEILS